MLAAIWEGVLSLLVIALGLGLLYWIPRFNASRHRGERMILKWSELSRGKQTVGILALSYLFLNLYLSTASLLGSLGLAALPLGSTESSITISSTAVALLGMAYVQTLRYPRKKEQAPEQ